MVIHCCPTCGHPRAEGVPGAKLTPTESVLFSAIQRAGQAGIDVPGLVDAVYSGVRHGGPDFANCVIHVTKRRLQKKLAQHGLMIHSTKGHGARYTLRRLGDD